MYALCKTSKLIGNSLKRGWATLQTKRPLWHKFGGTNVHVESARAFPNHLIISLLLCEDLRYYVIIFGIYRAYYP